MWVYIDSGQQYVVFSRSLIVYGYPLGTSDTRYNIIKLTKQEVNNNAFLQIKLSYLYILHEPINVIKEVFRLHFVDSFTNDFINLKLTVTLFYVRFYEIILGAFQVFVNFLEPFRIPGNICTPFLDSQVVFLTVQKRNSIIKWTK